MGIQVLFFAPLLFLAMNSAYAQVDPGNDPVMWNYVDPTQFWIILVVLVVVGGGFTVYFRRKPPAKESSS